ncbi:MAG: hypothetical protein Q4A66_12345, partial [Eubacteriales bacterium]|nr:hypothetical protein [Eubacteriales bacterium]
AINALTAWTAYACGRRIFGGSAEGVCASALYTLASYRLTDVYVRMALGEAVAMAVLPLFILGLWEVVFGDRNRWPVLTLGASAVFLSHILSTVLCGALAALVCAVCCVRIVREGRVMAILKAAGATALVCAFFLVPLVQGMMSGVGMGALNSSVSAAALEPSALLAADPDFPLDVGPALLLASALSLYALCGCAEERAKTARRFLLLGAAFALMATDLFPWALLERRTYGAVNFLQFPWRLLMFTDLFLALGCGYGLCRLSGENKWKELAAPAVLVLCVLAAYPQLTAYTTEDNAPLRYFSSNTQMITAYAEYTLPGTDLAATKDCGLISDGVEIAQYEKKGTRISAEVSSPEGGFVSFPLFGFDGYAAALDGEKIPWRLGDNNRLTVDLAPGAQGEIAVRFEGRTLWRVFDGVSLLSLAAMAAFAFRRRKGEKVESKQK